MVQREFKQSTLHFAEGQQNATHWNQAPQRQADQRRTVREMSPMLTVNTPWCILLPPNGNFEIRSAFIHHIPKYHGMGNENSTKHVKDFFGNL